jgi:hypothetical protein
VYGTERTLYICTVALIRACRSKQEARSAQVFVNFNLIESVFIINLEPIPDWSKGCVLHFD